MMLPRIKFKKILLIIPFAVREHSRARDLICLGTTWGGRALNNLTTNSMACKGKKMVSGLPHAVAAVA